MKIRNDFVTNSSSSSFILSFKNKDEAINTIENMIEKFTSRKEHYLMLLSDIKNSQALTADEIEKIIVSEAEMSAYYRVRFNNSYIEAWTSKNPNKNRWDFYQSKEFKKLCDKEAIEYANELRCKINKDGFTIKLIYSDNSGPLYSELEHQIVPHLENTVATFNHH